MRVAFLIGPFPKLSKTFILDQVIGLMERGVDLDVFAQPAENQTKNHPDFMERDIASRTFYPYRNATNSFQRFLWLPGLFSECFREDYKNVFKPLNFFKYGKDALLLNLLYEAHPFFGRQPYDIIHSHFGPYGIMAQHLLEMGILKGKLVTSFHGIDVSAYISAKGSRVYNKLFSHCDLFLPVSQSWKGKLISLGCDEKKITVHHMGVDCRKFSFSPRKWTPDNGIRLVSIGRLTEKKGLEYGIRAVAHLIKEIPNVSYTIVGDGPLRTALTRLAMALDVGKNVHLPGWKDRNEVIEILEQSHILLAPSITASDGDMEGIPMVLMEAMAMGIPVISTTHSGIPELVEDGTTGLLVPEGDSEGLSKMMEELINSPRLAQDLAENARGFIEENFNLDKQNDRLLQHYGNLLDIKEDL